jgi:23S rRNA U2552 (ribose-2'-O)-methylase RlmE/FtsJ
MYQPIVFKLLSGKADILDKESKNNVITSSTVNLPLSSLGYHVFIKRTRGAMNITKNLETKNEFYYVVNPFEVQVPNYQDNVKSLSKIYLGLKDDIPEISSKSFYKLWEMLFLFDLADQKELTYASLGEMPGAFIQAVLSFRQKLGKGIDKDQVYSVSINQRENDIDYETLNKEFLGVYKKNYPKLITSFTNKEKTNHKAKTSKNDSMSQYKKEMNKNKTYADLITADGSLDNVMEPYQESEYYQLILAELVSALKTQAHTGNLILKMGDSFTIPTLKLIYLMSDFYSETYIYKPFYSRVSDTEKYLVCKNFKYDQKKDSKLLENRINRLEKILEEMGTNDFVFDILPELNLPTEFVDQFKFINIKLANPQQIVINEIVKYIKENNYFGEKYHDFREKQINATKWWVSNFYPPSNNLYEKNKEELQKLLKNTMDKYQAEMVKFNSTLTKN